MTITGSLRPQKMLEDGNNDTHSQNKSKDSCSKNILRVLDTTVGNVRRALGWLLLRSHEGVGQTEHSFVTMCPGQATQAWALDDCLKWQATRTPPHHMTITTAISASKTQNHTQRRAHKHIHTYAHIHAHMQSHPHTHMHSNTYKHLHTCMYLHTCSYNSHTCCTHTHTHTCAQTHTHVHMHRSDHLHAVYKAPLSRF